MTKSDRQRVLEGLKRGQDRYTAAIKGQGEAIDVLAITVDWLRSNVKLAARFLEGGDNGWTDEHVLEAIKHVGSWAYKLDVDIRDELTKQ